MYNTTSLGGGFLGFPDCCKTPPAGMAPLPYPNFGTHLLAPNPCFRILFCGAPVHNKGTIKAISFGDQPGVAGGIASQVFMSKTSHLANYSKTYKLKNKPSVRFTGIEKSNRRNVIVFDVAPSVQFKVETCAA
ncbi:MAG TPA: DUF4150 domain-containing protein [Advenella sp.]|nr:DUF4150 domain-containing protein [Advenella sp.]